MAEKAESGIARHGRGCCAKTTGGRHKAAGMVLIVYSKLVPPLHTHATNCNTTHLFNKFNSSTPSSWRNSQTPRRTQWTLRPNSLPRRACPFSQSAPNASLAPDHHTTALHRLRPLLRHCAHLQFEAWATGEMIPTSPSTDSLPCSRILRLRISRKRRLGT